MGAGCFSLGPGVGPWQGAGSSSRWLLIYKKFRAQGVEALGDLAQTKLS